MRQILRTLTARAALATIAAFAAVPSQGATPQSDVVGTVRILVDPAAAESPHGAADLQAHIRMVAHRLCGQSLSESRVDYREAMHACTEDAVADAMRQLRLVGLPVPRPRKENAVAGR